MRSPPTLAAPARAQRFFLDQHAFLGQVVGGLVLGELEDDDLRQAPPGQNALSYLLWHATRWEDVLVNTWVVRRPQVLDSDDWLNRLALESRHVGTALTHAEAAALARRVDLPALRAYTVAVSERTVDVVRSLPDAAFEESIEDIRLQLGAADGAHANPRAPWLDTFFAGHTVAWHLAFLNVHLAEHLVGEALAVRGQLGIPLGL
jgi:hypothetical protein